MKLVPRRPSVPGAALPNTAALRHTTITFGPFAGRPVCQLDDAYLYQLVNRRLWPVLRDAVEAELEFRAALRRRAG